MSNPEKFMGHT